MCTNTHGHTGSISWGTDVFLSLSLVYLCLCVGEREGERERERERLRERERERLRERERERERLRERERERLRERDCRRRRRLRGFLSKQPNKTNNTNTNNIFCQVCARCKITDRSKTPVIDERWIFYSIKKVYHVEGD